MTVRELYRHMSRSRTMLAETVGLENRFFQMFNNTIKLLDAVAVRYPEKSIESVIDELHDRSYEEWKETQNANH